ncbi:ABC transporter permease [Thermopolyspora flexuosa]|uniref:Iron complex transport system ATP-binding protein n=1 Tax=Thermopolyspora flexuosa TaxID=103836 RepID=A0A543IX44_9ACTN|nr:ABC transporter ATP-binding protein [Thermopolyspora flexuosa]PZN43393.1 MAG: iron ABC transporter ATP-binding protein [Actinomycetota bacterium]TQM75143.1 iron complex transport system ATP-binding protein [Thermopolyspora flexuosa]GGM91841.1 ABC transporter permease [Thermopolyspora flexuosa]
MIEIRNVTKRYGEHAVVDRVSLTIPRGGVTSIIGANGAGKSTLLSIISRLLPADEGTVTVDGMDVATTPTERLARRLAILRQDNHMPVRLTVRELVAFGRFPHTGGRLTAEDHRLVDEALRYFELTDLADRHLDQLSGGQRQRAFVAMTLCQDTDYVLLDEPLNNLDMRHSVQMMRRLRRMAEDYGKTVVIVVHDINFASCHSDVIVAMKHGRVIAQGPTAEMMTPEILGEVYDLDIDVHELSGRRIGVYFA